MIDRHVPGRDSKSQRTLVAMPMKPFELAKARLSPAFTDERRERLVRALFLRTQRFFAIQFKEFDRLVITPSKGVREVAERLSARCLLEDQLDGLNAAADRAIAWATEGNYSRLLLIPGDVPVWTRAEVHSLLAHGDRHGAVIARARDGGTNALVLRLPTAFACSFGPDSAKRHLLRARATGLSATLCRLPFLAHDLDVPEDCLVLAAKTRIAVAGA